MRPFRFRHCEINLYQFYEHSSSAGKWTWSITYPESQDPDKIRRHGSPDGHPDLAGALRSLFTILGKIANADPSKIDTL